MASFSFTDNGEFITLTTDGTRSIDIKKKYVKTRVSGVFLVISWHDKERRRNVYEKWIDYNDVTSPTVSDATDLQTQLDGWISGGTGGGVQSVTDDGNGVVTVNNTDPLNPVIEYNPEQIVKAETGDYTLAIGDEFNFIEFADAGSSVDITVPTNASEPFPIGTWIDISSDTTQAVNVVGDTGVTVNALLDYRTLAGRYAQARIIKVGTNEWDLYGDLIKTLDPDAFIYIQALIAAGVTPNTTQTDAIDNLFKSLKTNNIYTKMIAMYPIFGGSSATHKLNALDPQDTDAAFRATFTGSPTHAATGITFNGTTQFANTQVIPTTHMTQNNTGMTVALRVNANTGAAIGVYGSGSSQMDILPRFSGTAYSDSYNAGLGRISTGAATAIGIWTQSRTNSTTHKLFKDGVQVGATDTDSVTGWSSLTYKIYYGAWNQAGAAAQYFASEFSFVAIHEGLSDLEADYIYDSIIAFNTALGR